MFRTLFPSFQQPADRPRYLNVEPERRNFRGVGIVLSLAAFCGVALALWEPSGQVTTPFVTSAAPRSAPATDGAQTETTASVGTDDDQTTPTVKLSTLCSQRATARRDCANVRALKDARNAPEPDSEPAVASAKEAKPVTAAAEASSPESKPAAVTAKTSGPEPKPVVVPESKPAAVAAKVLSPILPKAAPAPAVTQPVAVVASEESHPVPPADIPNAQQPKTTSASKAKRPRPAEEAPVERLVRVYDQVLPDGRRVPVYRRAGSGALEMGTIVDGEYRPARRANLDPPSGRNFGLQ